MPDAILPFIQAYDQQGLNTSACTGKVGFVFPVTSESGNLCLIRYLANLTGIL